MQSEPSSGIKLTAYICICWLFHRIYYDARNHKHKIQPDNFQANSHLQKYVSSSGPFSFFKLSDIFRIFVYVSNKPACISKSSRDIVLEKSKCLKNSLVRDIRFLIFRHRASSIQGQAFHYSPEDAFYIFNQQIYFII